MLTENQPIRNKLGKHQPIKSKLVEIKRNSRIM